MRFRIGRAGVMLSVGVGVLVGLGAFTFNFGEGLSYMSNDPKACVNCHIMRAEYDSWQQAGHHHVATCNDCHLPTSGIGKYIAKARNGYNHSMAFTLQNFPEPIQITPPNARILQENCLRCHGEFVHNITPVAGGDSPNAVQCVHCHMRVGHGPVGGRPARFEQTPQFFEVIQSRSAVPAPK